MWLGLISQIAGAQPQQVAPAVMSNALDLPLASFGRDDIRIHLQSFNFVQRCCSFALQGITTVCVNHEQYTRSTLLPRRVLSDLYLSRIEHKTAMANTMADVGNELTPKFAPFFGMVG